MRPYAFEKGLGTQWWVKHDIDRINAYYGSLEKYYAIKSWKQMLPPDWEKNQERAESKGEIVPLDHGYDTSKSIYSLFIRGSLRCCGIPWWTFCRSCRKARD